ncbi:hypothetical protein FA95DRAFT_1610178 [Auriscalpium vulgare]|uniref:Uncharacterized protein n=1 Tax=Auriscalpium vulgare TaxID=40419 RepID=A0ACB8REL5_9AGAM|nr:hypothetical protein FA95DRAFT_1610178 [Auriscalpium vulgare]
MVLQAELVNAPAIGVQTNKFFGTTQVNVSPAQPADSDTSHIKELAKYGGPHYDGGDSVSGLTGMVACPEIPEEFKLGTFHLVEADLFVCLEGLQVAYFNSLWRHGGTPPCAPAEQAVPN